MKNKKSQTKFSEIRFWNKLKIKAKTIGVKMIYIVLLLYYAYKKKETPKWAKKLIAGAIAYFISPIDLIPDLTPILGYTDDMILLTVSLSTVAIYIDSEVKTKAKERVQKWFGDILQSDSIEVVDSMVKEHSDAHKPEDISTGEKIDHKFHAIRERYCNSIWGKY